MGAAFVDETTTFDSAGNAHIKRVVRAAPVNVPAQPLNEWTDAPPFGTPAVTAAIRQGALAPKERP